MILIKNCRVFSSEDLGTKDVCLAGEKIVAIEESISLPDALGAEILDAADLKMMPGLIDGHVHIAGAGGL